MLDAGGILDERGSGIDQRAERVSREIIERRAESARHDQRAVRIRELAHRARERLGVVAHGPPLAGHGAVALQLAREPRRVRVLDLSEHELVADGEDRDAPLRQPAPPRPSRTISPYWAE